MIYTSYFAKLNKLPNDIVPIPICGKLPNWYKNKMSQYKKLAPKYDFFMEWKQNHDNDYYIKCYKEQVLGRLNVNNVVHDLFSISKTYDSFMFYNAKDVCLICYEKPTDFCHRHLVADWLNENGYKCEEYKFD